jgi:hypothetical protein
MANQLGVTGSKVKQAVSGISKEWDFRASNSLLVKTATAAKKTEIWCAKTWGDYFHTEIKYTLDYPKEFCEAYSQARMEAALSILNGKTPPPPNLAKELWIETTKVFFDDDPARAKTIADQINTSYAQDLQDKETEKQAQLDQINNPQPEEGELKDTVNKLITNNQQKKPPVNKSAQPNAKSLKVQA